MINSVKFGIALFMVSFILIFSVVLRSIFISRSRIESEFLAVQSNVPSELEVQSHDESLPLRNALEQDIVYIDAIDEDLISECSLSEESEQDGTDEEDVKDLTSSTHTHQRSKLAHRMERHIQENCTFDDDSLSPGTECSVAMTITAEVYDEHGMPIKLR